MPASLPRQYVSFIVCIQESVFVLDWIVLKINLSFYIKSNHLFMERPFALNIIDIRY